jgi:AcrR family transcriptional regulator
MTTETLSKARRNDKRDRLVQAADQLIYEQTFHNTTLAHIATLADVPLGNVYYYFKTKDDIMHAVLAHRSKQQQALFTAWNALPKVSERLSAMLQHMVSQAETIAQHGGVTGSLTQELGKDATSVLGNVAAKILQDSLKWVQTQFEALGCEAEAPVLAAHWIANLEGMMLLSSTFKNPELMAEQSKVLERWLQTFVLKKVMV